MYNPVSTYRVQLHENFTFADLERQLDYLQQLGVTTIYASPTLAATPGSTHGYDGIDPQRINPEIGTLDQLRGLSQQLKARNMGWLQDIVPNHLAYHPANPWISDVLEKGHQSLYANYFDIPGTNELFDGTLMAPFLGQKLADIIKNGELRVAYLHQRLVLQYYDSHFPLAPHTYAQALVSEEQQQADVFTTNVPAALSQWLTQIEGLFSPESSHPVIDGDSQQQVVGNRPVNPKEAAVLWDDARLELAALMADDETVQHYVDTRLAWFNQSADDLHALCEEQHYRLCDGDETRRRINFRRFFTVNGLICLAVERPDVFDHVHHFVRELVADGTLQGLRIDHIDGLFDPTGYLEKLRQTMGDETYIVVEKILEPGEAMPVNWPIQGSSGYDYLALVNNLLTDPTGKEAFTTFYEKLVGNSTAVHDQILSRKAYILYHDMGGELANLYKFFYDQQLATDAELAAVNQTMLLLAIAELLVQCPVYRYYGNQFPLEADEASALRQMLDGVRSRAVELQAPADLLEMIWLTKPQQGDVDYNARALRFYQRCMQFTGPLMAKGVEDTLLYTYFRFIGHNEVGDSAEAFGMNVPHGVSSDFHRAMQERQAKWPLAMNGTSTHDTKRGEDVRARLNVLTALGDEWTTTARRWLDQTAVHRPNYAPDTNDAYFILQTLVGAHPFAGQDEDEFPTRLHEYVTKALQEAKRHTSWTAPNKAYMKATHAYIDHLLDKTSTFWVEFDQFMVRIADFAVINSLAQVLLKFTTPGVPDVYQGCEMHDLSLVDPDNRRPVDYAQRNQLLLALNGPERTQPIRFAPNQAGGPAQPGDLWEKRLSGQTKFWLTHHLLTIRQAQPDFWATADYIPLVVEGTYRDHIMAFARQQNGAGYVTVVPLYLARLCRETGASDPTAISWQDTRVIFPAHRAWTDQLTGTTGGSTTIRDLFGGAFPLAFIRYDID
ncbi:malto-oligosyltrehalose synthase [Fibrella arboris]|uniref:malto-oligosyltrehalose synthase n=1 Tax=Fibrella arboris TaxID=3242486 RepID=UPI0035215DD4